MTASNSAWTAGELGKFIFETIGLFEDHGLEDKVLERAVGRAVFIRLFPNEEPAETRKQIIKKNPPPWKPGEIKAQVGIKTEHFMQTSQDPSKVKKQIT